MSLYRIFGFAVLGLVLILVLRRMKEEYASFVSLFLCLGFTVCAMGILTPVIEYLRTFDTNADSGLFTLLFKASGIALVTTLAADVCRDCGETALASKTELCGKSVILALCLPLLKDVFGQTLALLN